MRRGGAGSGGDSIQWQPIPPTMKSIFAVAVSPDGGRFVAAGRVNQIEMYDVPPGARRIGSLIRCSRTFKFDGHPMYPDGAADRDFVHALAFSPDGTLLAAAGYRVVKLWKRPHNVQKQSVSLAAAPTALAVSPDGSLVATALADHSIVLRRDRGGRAAEAHGPDGGPSARCSLRQTAKRSTRHPSIAPGEHGTCPTAHSAGRSPRAAR